MSKESFKNFVKKNPYLVKYVKEKNASWQKIYETYELYGEDNNIWNEYKIDNKVSNSLTDIFNTIKTIDLDRLQSGIQNVQNAISLIQNFGNNNTNIQPETKYQYKHLDD